jgi:hypothetical protein
VRKSNAEQFDMRVDRDNVTKNPWTQLDAVECCLILRQCNLIPRAGRDELIDGMGQQFSSC